MIDPSNESAPANDLGVVGPTTPAATGGAAPDHQTGMSQGAPNPKSAPPAAYPSSGLNDGYGDSLSEVELMLAEEEEFFVRNARNTMVKKYGKGFAPGSEADAVQEARIAAWLSWQQHQNRAYMNIATRQRLMKFVYDEAPAFGSDTSRGNNSGASKDPLRRAQVSIDDPDNEVLLVAAEALEAVALAYHEGEIIEAINSLLPDVREYVVLRYWGGYTPTEIAAMQGKTRGGVSSMWTKALPGLRERLEHLRELVH